MTVNVFRVQMGFTIQRVITKFVIQALKSQLFIQFLRFFDHFETSRRSLAITRGATDIPKVLSLNLTCISMRCIYSGQHEPLLNRLCRISSKKAVMRTWGLLYAYGFDRYSFTRVMHARRN